jgi:phosphopantetheinyl transferase (holo-ACP synthase)
MSCSGLEYENWGKMLVKNQKQIFQKYQEFYLFCNVFFSVKESCEKAVSLPTVGHRKLQWYLG